jgi:hypothetical protein
MYCGGIHPYGFARLSGHVRELTTVHMTLPLSKCSKSRLAIA